MASKIKTHLGWVRPGPFGSEMNGPLCGRMVLGDDGMNQTDNPDKVTCKICLKKIALLRKLPKRKLIRPVEWPR